MSDDEIAVFVVSSVLGFALWISWYGEWTGVRARKQSGGLVLGLAPVLAAAGLFAVLTSAASADVRDDATYLLFYMALGSAWSAGLVKAFDVLGLSARDDVSERGNRAAAWAISGAIVGGAATY